MEVSNVTFQCLSVGGQTKVRGPPTLCSLARWARPLPGSNGADTPTGETGGGHLNVGVCCEPAIAALSAPLWAADLPNSLACGGRSARRPFFILIHSFNFPFTLRM